MKWQAVFLALAIVIGVAADMQYPEMTPAGSHRQIPGYPLLRAAPQADVTHLSGRVLGALEQAAQALRRVLTIFSGYRSPAYSAQVGGYSTDPHTRGVAADVTAGSIPIGSLPGAFGLLSRLGLESGAQPGFYRGAPDPSHVQIPGSGRNKTIVDYGRQSGGALSLAELESLWTQAGGSAQLAPVMAAVALAESGGDPTQHNYNPSTADDSWGLWQINYFGSLGPARTRAFGPATGMVDPLRNARAAVSLAAGGRGLDNWSTYRSGAYRAYLGSNTSASGSAVPYQTLPRPGGGDGGGSAQLASAGGVFGGLWHSLQEAITLGPLSFAPGGIGGVFDAAKKLVAALLFLLDPVNWLRGFELLAGLLMILLGLNYLGRSEGGPSVDVSRLLRSPRRLAGGASGAAGRSARAGVASRRRTISTAARTVE